MFLPVRGISQGEAEFEKLLAEYEGLEKQYQELEATYNLLVTSFSKLKVRADIVPKFCEGRLTPATGAPVGGSSNTIYFTPYKGNRLSLYNGTTWRVHTLSEISYAGAPLGGGVTINDYFVYNNSGTLTLEPSANWASTSARTDALAMNNGVLVKSSDHTRRYVGTARWTGASFFDQTSARMIWNYCNRLVRSSNGSDGTDTYAKSATTWADNNPTNAPHILIGLTETLLRAENLVAAGSALSTTGVSAGIGLTTTSNVAQLLGGFADAIAPKPLRGVYVGYPAYGYYRLYGVTTTTGTSTTFYGDFGASTIVKQGQSFLYEH